MLRMLVCFEFGLAILETYTFWILCLGDQPGTDLGPVLSVKAKNRICDLVQSGVDEGAKMELDGRNVIVPGYEKGNFVGPTILSNVKVIFERSRLPCLYVCLSVINYQN